MNVPPLIFDEGCTSSAQAPLLLWCADIVLSVDMNCTNQKKHHFLISPCRHNSFRAAVSGSRPMMASTVSQAEMKKRVSHKVSQCKYASPVPVLLWALEPEAVLALGVVLGYLYTTGDCSTGNKWPLKLGDPLRLCEKMLRAGRVKLKLSTEFASCNVPFSGFP